MADCYISRFIYLLLFFFTSTFVNGDTFFNYENYDQYGIDNEQICNPTHPENKNKVIILKNKHKGIIIKPGHIFSDYNLYRSEDRSCIFEIEANGQGLFAVVQKMKLRGNKTHCKDYITFLPNDKTKDKDAPKYCGVIDLSQNRKYTPSLWGMLSKKNDEDKTDISENGNYDMYESNGKIRTKIFISQDKFEEGELDLYIAYTPYNNKECKRNEKTVFQESPTKCVDKKFLCDNVYNCEHSMCFDELHCNKEIFADPTGTRVTISAVSSILMCFILFFLCLWICRRNEKLCWSPDCAGPTTISGTISGLPSGPGDQTISSPPYVSTAPMLEVAVPSSVHDKDLPPSYDSLFPPQSTIPSSTTATSTTTTT